MERLENTMRDFQEDWLSLQGRFSGFAAHCKGFLEEDEVVGIRMVVGEIDQNCFTVHFCGRTITVALHAVSDKHSRLTGCLEFYCRSQKEPEKIVWNKVVGVTPRGVCDIFDGHLRIDQEEGASELMMRMISGCLASRVWVKLE